MIRFFKPTRRDIAVGVLSGAAAGAITAVALIYLFGRFAQHPWQHQVAVLGILVLVTVPVTVMIIGWAEINHWGGPDTPRRNLPYSLVGVAQGVILAETFDAISDWRYGWPSGVAMLLVVAICAHMGVLVAVTWLMIRWARARKV